MERQAPNGHHFLVFSQLALVFPWWLYFGSILAIDFLNCANFLFFILLDDAVPIDELLL